MGVGIATVTDLQLNVVGSVLSLLAVVTTCIAQIVSWFNWFYNFFYFSCVLESIDTQGKYAYLSIDTQGKYAYLHKNLTFEYWRLVKSCFFFLLKESFNIPYIIPLSLYILNTTLRWLIPFRRSSRFLQPSSYISHAPIKQWHFSLSVHLLIGIWQVRVFLLSIIPELCWYDTTLLLYLPLRHSNILSAYILKFMFVYYFKCRRL